MYSYNEPDYDYNFEQTRFPALLKSAQTASAETFRSQVDEFYSENEKRFAKAVMTRDESNNTVLHVAAKYQDDSAFYVLFRNFRAATSSKSLLDALFQKNSAGETVLDLAIKHHPSRLADLLQNIFYTGSSSPGHDENNKPYFLNQLLIAYPQGKIPQPLLEMLFLSREIRDLDKEFLQKIDLNTLEAAYSNVNQDYYFRNTITIHTAKSIVDRRKMEAKIAELNVKDSENSESKQASFIKVRSSSCFRLAENFAKLFQHPALEPKKSTLEKLLDGNQVIENSLFCGEFNAGVKYPQPSGFN